MFSTMCRASMAPASMSGCAMNSGIRRAGSYIKRLSKARAVLGNPLSETNTTSGTRGRIPKGRDPRARRSRGEPRSGFADPFDRLVVATARRLAAPLLTSDEQIASSGLVDVVWA
jgi:hypothetical protein